eukprot:CAMPEP_0202959762 /NCGR_PEP_ID=MMETSP1396-20130829/3940_1 /ASSEMBLY_ACC=CAM_ASM_000872 /TAXON_ID= /ORGANISM="Pseudokeronopsis sp., Strain Brazil" /LENGTH=87 /DNA_ID=CAMNT_0049678521 /DNA_START=1446 /DNA_END=1709 /DNA_ORIENTATION=+
MIDEIKRTQLKSCMEEMHLTKKFNKGKVRAITKEFGFMTEGGMESPLNQLKSTSSSKKRVKTEVEVYEINSGKKLHQALKVIQKSPN